MSRPDSTKLEGYAPEVHEVAPYGHSVIQRVSETGFAASMRARSGIALLAIGFRRCMWLLAAPLMACSGDTATPPVQPEPQPPASVPQPVRYRVDPPPGKLPWPQHDPNFDASAYDAMMERLHVANNFGLYQAARPEDPASIYLHNGLDIVLPNGTRLYAVQSGRVREVDSRAENYYSVTVEDEDGAGAGWAYVHVSNIRVRPGEYVARGTHIADVKFLPSLPHVHLSRVHRVEGGDWARLATLARVQPDTFFAYRDTEPPLFSGPFRYFRNESEVELDRRTRPVLSGDVDIVAGMRDVGESARAAGSVIGDRLAVSRIEYEISGPGGIQIRRPSFDFTRLTLWTQRSPTYDAKYDEAASIFKFYNVLHPGGTPPWWQTKTSYYVVTNVPAEGRQGIHEPADRAHAWRTGERDGHGRPLWPNGDYVVTVRAWDHKGNRAEQSDTVVLLN